MTGSAAVGGRVVRAVLLDVDDTLVDTRASFRAAVRHVQATWLPQLDPSRSQELLAHWVGDPGGHFRAYTRGECDFPTQRRRRAEDLHATFGGPVLDDAAYQAWVQGYDAAFRAAYAACPDATGLLDRVEAAGLFLGAVTNAGADFQREKLTVVGLLHRLPVLVTIDDLGRGKPDPEVFALACRRLGVPPGECAYIGDELDVDARGARDAGLVGIWLDRHRTGHTPQDVPVVRGLAEVPALLGLPG
ncbi:MAG TPA: HAD family hydrolase [Kineosporiaceae bacterium]|nr:HAD family hydrolase [Kineosporiaceae bacterium]